MATFIPHRREAEQMADGEHSEPPRIDELAEKLAEAQEGLHGSFREGWIARRECDLGDEDNSRCPFCGWDIQEDWNDGVGCVHFLTMLLCEWDDGVGPEGGTTGGSLEHAAGASFGSLNTAVSEFLQSTRSQSTKCPQESLAPARLCELVKTVGAGTTFDGDVDDDTCERRSLQADSAAYGRYIRESCKAAGIAVTCTHYDSGDPFGTSPYAFWTADPAGAANELARAVNSDLETLSAAIARCSDLPRRDQ
jgi:hypothetical protein